MADKATKDQPTEDIQTTNPDVVTKYKTAAEITNKILKSVADLCIDGAKVLDICTKGDELILEACKAVYNKKKDGKTVEKGIAFPTCISLNNCVGNFSPLASDAEIVLKKGDVCTIELGAHIDGYPAITGTTIVVGASKSEPVTGKNADLIAAAYTATEAALRLFKAGQKGKQAAETIEKVVSHFDCKIIEGCTSTQVVKNNLNGEKKVVLNPSDEQRSGKDIEFADHEVYIIDVSVSSGEGKPRVEGSRTTLYRKTDTTYMLKMKTSRAILSEITQKFGSMVFSLRSMEDEKKSRMGIIECFKHGLVDSYDVKYEASKDDVVAKFKITALLLPSGTLKITTPLFDNTVIVSDKKVQDPELHATITASLKNKKKKAAKEDSEVKTEA